MPITLTGLTALSVEMLLLSYDWTISKHFAGGARSARFHGGWLSSQAARALRDIQLLDTLKHMQNRNERQLTWLKTRINQAAPQILTVPL